MLKVWTYWEGPMPPYISICLASIKRCCSDFDYNHVTPETIGQFIPKDQLPSDGLCPAIRCDVIRASLLARFGGLYVDADTVFIRSPRGRVEADVDLLYAVWRKLPRRVLNGYVYARPGSLLAQEWYEQIKKKLAMGRHGWAELGERTLTPLVDSGLYCTQLMPREVFLPIDVDADRQKLFAVADWLDYVKPCTIAFGLNHSWMMQNHTHTMNLPAEEMAKSDSLICRLLTDAANGVVVEC